MKNSQRLGRLALLLFSLLMQIGSPAWSLEVTKPVATERREALSLADAVVRALQQNLDISISRQTKDSRIADIVIEQAKFDPTLSLNGQYNRQVAPLNRPVLGSRAPICRRLPNSTRMSSG